MTRFPLIRHQLANLPGEEAFAVIVREALDRTARKSRTCTDEHGELVIESRDQYSNRRLYMARRPQGEAVGVDVIRQYAQRDTDRIAVVTNTRFTDQAESEAAEADIALVDGEELAMRIAPTAQQLLEEYYEPPTVHSVADALELMEAFGRMVLLPRDRTMEFDDIEPIGHWQGQSRSARLDSYRDAISALFKFGYLDEDDLPIFVSDGNPGRYLLNTEPVHSDGESMKEHEYTEIQDGVYLNHHDVYDDKCDRLQHLAENYIAEGPSTVTAGTGAGEDHVAGE